MRFQPRTHNPQHINKSNLMSFYFTHLYLGFIQFIHIAFLFTQRLLFLILNSSSLIRSRCVYCACWLGTTPVVT